jgi:hypothetical protein
MRLASLFVLTLASVAGAEWSATVDVVHEFKPCLTYRAKLDGDLLVIQADLQPGWHTFTIDNERRAAEKLAGKPSIGIDQPTKITVAGGLEVVGPWYQSSPIDFSKPQMRWFSFGFENHATFAAKVRRVSAKPGDIGIRGQACTDKTCKNIDVEMAIPAGRGDKASPSVDLKSLIEVR